MMKTFKKILLMTLSWLMILFLASYEGTSITKKEYERQIQIANTAREQVALNLNMIKIAVQTEDDEIYGNNLAGLKEQTAVLEDLSYLKNRQSGYLKRLNTYIERLEEKREIISATKALSEKVKEVKEYLTKNYGNNQTATREKIREGKTKFEEIKVDLKYENSVQETVNYINDILNRLIEASISLSDCIDTCYKDRIEKINDELAGYIKVFSEKATTLNKSYENEFDFPTLNDLQ